MASVTIESMRVSMKFIDWFQKSLQAGDAYPFEILHLIWETIKMI
jgi:hypothetical protein